MSKRLPEKYWFHWKISNELWSIIRPFVKLMLDGTGEELTYAVSGCYDKLDLGVFNTRQGHRDFETALYVAADGLTEITDKTHEHGWGT